MKRKKLEAAEAERVLTFTAWRFTFTVQGGRAQSHDDVAAVARAVRVALAKDDPGRKMLPQTWRPGAVLHRLGPGLIEGGVVR